MTCTDGTVQEPAHEALLVATPTDSPTGRNLAATRTVGVGLGHARDVYGVPDVLLEAGQIEPGGADGDREGGAAQQMETR
jgi:hypothetical protein